MSSKSDPRPNIVLVCVDQWRGDCLQIDGHPVVETPFLNNLAMQGVRFDKAYSSSPTCIAARCAMFTGLSQRRHGRVGYDDSVEWNYRTTLAGELTRAGYQTQAVGKMHVQPERAQVGFENVILHDGFLHGPRREHPNMDLIDDYLPWLRAQLGRDADYYDHGVDCNGYVARPWDKPEHTHPTNFVTWHAMDFLRRRDPRKPFFLFMSYHRPHPPYDPPQWAFDQYIGQEMPPVPVGDWWSDLQQHHKPMLDICHAGRIDPRALHRARAGYYGHMTHIDHNLARFYEALEEHKVVHDTYILFVSDHGEMMGDHHLFRKAYGYEGSARVPLIVRPPRSVRCDRNSRRGELVELRDIMPTVLDIAGLPAPAGIDGASIMPLVRGGEMAARDYIHGEHCFLGMSMHFIVQRDFKYIWMSDTGREQLFDMANDPQELRDLVRAGTHQAKLAELRGVLVRELAGCEEGYSDGVRLVAGRRPTTTLSHARDVR